MRTPKLYLALVTTMCLCLAVGCNSGDSESTQVTPTPSGGEPADVSTRQVDFAAKAVDSSVAAVPNEVFRALGPEDVSGASAAELPDILAGAGLPEDGVVYEGDGITVTIEGFSTDPPGLFLGFVFDEFTPVEGGEETLSGRFTLLLCLDMAIPDSKVKLILNTEEGAPLVVSGGELDGMTLGFEDFAFYFSLGQGSLEPVGVEGTLLVNGTPVDLDMFEEQLLAQQGAVAFAALVLGSSVNGTTLTGLPDLLDGLTPDFELPGLPEDGVIYEGEGITITFDGISTTPPGLLLGFAFDAFAPVEGMEETVSGNLTLLVCVEIGAMDPKIKMILNTEEGDPLVISGGQLDGTTLAFEDFTFFFSLGEGAIAPVGVEGTLLVNGIPIDLDGLGDLLGG
ncbi:hypothetical protein [Desulfoluna butyratoxydans]|uniref:Lipoprotein n=1 Tax=Desulfoluna butyratoxydans TaxID=231438 RepID=A0A4U8YU95_9BACT|nr:hypothetical protein [Desulfoluna butyratoxydans]VFQ47147.1 hypothetical protein MSL71_48330 [Desulfoluna butyratoxydans]